MGLTIGIVEARSFHQRYRLGKPVPGVHRQGAAWAEPEHIAAFERLLPMFNLDRGSFMSIGPIPELFAPTHALEVVFRGTLIYLGLFFLLRIVLNRRAQGMSTPDVLLIVLIADAAQNGMAGEYKSITDGLLLVATLLFWDFLLDWLAFHIPAIENALRQPPLLLVRDGQMLRRNMKQELVTTRELLSLLREHGIVDVSQVGKAWLEDDGKLSVVSIRR